MLFRIQVQKIFQAAISLILQNIRKIFKEADISSTFFFLYLDVSSMGGEFEPSSNIFFVNHHILNRIESKFLFTDLLKRQQPTLNFAVYISVPLNKSSSMELQDRTHILLLTTYYTLKP